GVSLEGTIEDLETFLDLLFATGLAVMDSRDATSEYNESLANIDTTVDELTEKYGGMGEALNENKSDFDLTTEAGREANSAFQDLARDGMSKVEAKAREGLGQDELQGDLRQTYDDLIAAANGMGITGTAAEDLAREVMG